MKPAKASIELNIPHPILGHHVKLSTARVKLTPAKPRTIQGRYFPIFIKRVSMYIIASSFAVLGIAIEEDDEGEEESFSDMQIYLSATNDLMSIFINRFHLNIVKLVEKQDMG
jgi:hypothetical protein